MLERCWITSQRSLIGPKTQNRKTLIDTNICHKNPQKPYFCSAKTGPQEVVLLLTLEVVLFLTLERPKRGTKTNSPAHIYIYIHIRKFLIKVHRGRGQNFPIFISCRYLVELGPRQLGSTGCRGHTVVFVPVAVALEWRRAKWGWMLNGGVSQFVPKCPVGQIGTNGDKTGHSGTNSLKTHTPRIWGVNLHPSNSGGECSKIPGGEIFTPEIWGVWVLRGTGKRPHLASTPI